MKLKVTFDEEPNEFGVNLERDYREFRRTGASPLTGLYAAYGTAEDLSRDLKVMDYPDLALYVEVSHKPWRKVGYIKSIEVEPKLRGAGVGGQILSRALEEFQKLGVERVFAHLVVPEVFGFFRDFGFMALRHPHDRLMVVVLDLLPKRSGRSAV